MIFLAFLIFAALFVMGATAQGWSYIGLFLDVPSLLFTLLGIAGFFLVFGRKELGRGVKTFFAFSYPQDDHSPESGRFFLRLATFTLFWGFVGVLWGLLVILIDMNPDTVGVGIAFSLLSFLYASGIALFVFLPIGLRLSPPTIPLPGFWRLSIWQQLCCLLFFFLLAYLIVVCSDLGVFPPRFGFASIVLFIDVATLVLVVASWWIFRMASGKRRKWMAAPAIILMGLFWSIVGLVIMLGDLDPDTIGAGLAVTMLTTLYAFIGAIGFLIADTVSENRSGGVPSSLDDSEKTEQAKEILDRAVEKERG